MNSRSAEATRQEPFSDNWEGGKVEVVLFQVANLVDQKARLTRLMPARVGLRAIPGP